VFTDLADAAPATTRLEEALPPFTDAAGEALVSLGDAAEESQQPLVDSDPVIRQLRTLAISAAPAAKNLDRFLRSMRNNDGFRNLLRFVYRATGSFNAFDDLGHFARAFLLITNCNDYVTAPQTGCIANFIQAAEEDTESDAARKGERRNRRDENEGRDRRREPEREDQPGQDPGADLVPEIEGGEIEPTDPETTPVPETPSPEAPADPGPGNELPAEPGTESSPAVSGSSLRMRDARLLLDMLMGEPSGGKRDRRAAR
jgi:hypothetical protein